MIKLNKKAIDILTNSDKVQKRNLLIFIACLIGGLDELHDKFMCAAEASGGMLNFDMDFYNSDLVNVLFNDEGDHTDFFSLLIYDNEIPFMDALAVIADEDAYREGQAQGLTLIDCTRPPQ